MQNRNKPLLVGITGGIGAGKSLIARIFHTLGVPVYDADSRAKCMMTHDKNLIAEIKNHFGEEAYLADGLLNRAYLSEKVFNNEARLQQLNALVHPKVGEDFEQWASQQAKPYVLKEAALLIEAGSYKTLNYLITVNAPEKVRLSRVLLRDTHRSEEDVEAIMKKQLSDTERAEKADFVIVNDGSSLVVPKVLQLHKRFLQEGN